MTSFSSDQEKPAPCIYPMSGSTLQITIIIMPTVKVYMVVTRSVENNLNTAALLLFPSTASVSQVRARHSKKSPILSSKET